MELGHCKLASNSNEETTAQRRVKFGGERESMQVLPLEATALEEQPLA